MLKTECEAQPGALWRALLVPGPAFDKHVFDERAFRAPHVLGLCDLEDLTLPGVFRTARSAGVDDRGHGNSERVRDVSPALPPPASLVVSSRLGVGEYVRDLVDCFGALGIAVLHERSPSRPPTTMSASRSTRRLVGVLTRSVVASVHHVRGGFGNCFRMHSQSRRGAMIRDTLR